MSQWWSEAQDKIWSQSPWNKTIDPESKNILWTMEVSTEANRVKMGYIVIHGTLAGDLTLSVYDGQDLPS